MHFLLVVTHKGGITEFPKFFNYDGEVKRVIHIIAVAIVWVVSMIVLVTFIMFMDGNHGKAHAKHPVAGAENIHIADDKGSFKPLEFFDTGDKNIECPPQGKMTTDQCVVLANVQYHVKGDSMKDKSHRWTTTAIFLLVAYVLQMVASLVYFLHLLAVRYNYNLSAIGVGERGSQSGGSGSVQTTALSKVSSSVDSSDSQKRIVSTYSNAKVRNGQMQF